VNTITLAQSPLPDEIQSAFATLGNAVRAAAPSRDMKARYACFYLYVFAIGAWMFVGAQRVGWLDPGFADFWRSVVSALSVLSGFMITTMLFTGKLESAKSLTLEQLRQFANKSNHLLISQFCTLLSHVSGLLIVVALSATQLHHDLSQALVTLAGGFICTSVFRSLLIPLQIIELHRFSHAALLAEKSRQIKEGLPG
jgi:hypothetical protein